MIIELFSGILFWALLAVAGVGLLTAVNFERPGFAAIVAVVVVLILQLFTSLNPFGWITNHPIETLVWVLGYFAIGTLYVALPWLGRWAYYVRMRREDIQSGFNSFKGLTRNANVPLDQLKKDFKGSTENPVRLRDHKRLILLWLNFWPASFVWMVVHVPLKHGWQFIYSNITGLLARIANNEIDKALR